MRARRAARFFAAGALRKTAPDGVSFFVTGRRNFSSGAAEESRMVSFEHEVLLSLFQTRPELAAELLRVLGVEVPAHRAARTDSADLTELAPTAYRADLVVLEDGGSVLGVVVEVQLDWAPANTRDKPRSREADDLERDVGRATASSPLVSRRAGPQDLQAQSCRVR